MNNNLFLIVGVGIAAYLLWQVHACNTATPVGIGVNPTPAGFHLWPPCGLMA